MNLSKLVELDDQTHRALGWHQGGDIRLNLHNEQEGDCLYTCDVQEDLVTGDLKTLFDGLYVQVRRIWGGYARSITFLQLEDGDNAGTFYVAVMLREIFQKTVGASP